MVLGVPRGGTSAVAGVLYHLGVDMGDLRQNNGSYCSFEDKNAVFLNKKQKPTRTHEGLQNYIDKRLAGSNPAGAKLFVGDLLQSQRPTNTFVLKVVRPIEDSIKSDISKNPNANCTEVVDGIIQRLTTAASEANCVEADYTLEYDKLVENPAREIVALVKAAGLNPTREQLQKGIDFVCRT